MTDNTNKKQFEWSIQGHTAYIEYIINTKGVIFLTHTEVPKALQGEGIGSKIVFEALQEAENRDLDVVPLCPFVAAYIRRHPEWKRVLADNYNV